MVGGRQFAACNTVQPRLVIVTKRTAAPSFARLRFGADLVTRRIERDGIFCSARVGQR